jgi:hypothetical protein
MAKTEPLTEQEQQALDQMRRAQEQGLTLKPVGTDDGTGGAPAVSTQTKSGAQRSI